MEANVDPNQPALYQKSYLPLKEPVHKLMINEMVITQYFISLGLAVCNVYGLQSVPPVYIGCQDATYT